MIVTRLDSAPGKKQVWCPNDRTWGRSKANVLYWRNMHLWYCWDLSAHLAIIWRPDSYPAPGKFCHPWLHFVTPLISIINLLTRVYVHAGCKQYCKYFSVALKIFNVFNKEQMYDSVMMGKESASEDWNCITVYEYFWRVLTSTLCLVVHVLCAPGFSGRPPSLQSAQGRLF